MPVKRKNVTRPKESYWHFALVNGRLAEVYFSGNRAMGHCDVKAAEYNTKKEQRWIIQDTQRYRLTYRNKRYCVKGTRQLI